jgi:hypothetical protein
VPTGAIVDQRCAARGRMVKAVAYAWSSDPLGAQDDRPDGGMRQRAA